MGGGRDMEAQDRYYMGVELCLEAGVLEECESHEGTYFQGNAELEDAYKLANAKITRGELGEPTKERRKEVTGAIKDAYDDNSGALQCYQCEKAFGPD